MGIHSGVDLEPHHALRTPPLEQRWVRVAALHHRNIPAFEEKLTQTNSRGNTALASEFNWQTLSLRFSV